MRVKVTLDDADVRRFGCAVMAMVAAVLITILIIASFGQ
jgi:hypothetical protein